MTQHTLKYIHKRRGFCKAVKAEPEKPPEPAVQQKPKITKYIVNDYIKECRYCFQLSTKWESNESTEKTNECKEFVKQCFLQF